MEAGPFERSLRVRKSSAFLPSSRAASSPWRPAGAPTTVRPPRRMTVSATRTGDAAILKYEDAAEVQLNSCPGAQPIQSIAPSRHEASLQAETLCCLG